MDETQQPQVVGTASLQEGGAGGLRGEPLLREGRWGEPWAVPVPAALPCPRSTDHVDRGWSCRFTAEFTPGFSVDWVTHSLFDGLCAVPGPGERQETCCRPVPVPAPALRGSGRWGSRQEAGGCSRPKKTWGRQGGAADPAWWVGPCPRPFNEGWTGS